MKSTAFISQVAGAYRVEEKTVQLYARLMKEAGLITSGARGVNAPHMHPRDAVRMTIALLATSSAARAVELYQRFSAMTYQPDRSSGPDPIGFGIMRGDSLENVLLSMFVDGLGAPIWSYSPWIEVHENDRTATIELNPPSIEEKSDKYFLLFETGERSEAMRASDRQAHAGIKITRGLSCQSLLTCALPFDVERIKKASWETLSKERDKGIIDLPADKDRQPEKGLWFDRVLEGD